jgi:chromosomal replication initiation ATPase DnaA
MNEKIEKALNDLSPFVSLSLLSLIRNIVKEYRAGKTAEGAFHDICSLLNVNPKDVRGSSRKPYLFNARVFITVVLRKFFGLSFIKIGCMINRDHATCIYYLKAFEKRKGRKIAYKEFNEDYEKIKEKYDV